MTVVSLVLLALMIPLSVLAARGMLWRAPSALRKCCTVLNALAVYGVLLYFALSASDSMAQYGQGGEYLGYLAAALIALWWAVAAGAALFHRFRVARVIGVFAIVLAHAGVGLFLSLRHAEEIGFTTLLVEVSACVCLVTWLNLLLTYEKKGRRALSLVMNVLAFAALATAAVWALRQGAAVLRETGGGDLALLPVGAAITLLLAPAAICAGSIVIDAFREASGDDGEDDPAE